MRKKKSILITCIGGGLSFQFIELLKNSSRFDYFVVGVDMSNDVQAQHVCDVFQTVPHGSDPDYSDRILELAKQHSVEMIFPWSDVDVSFAVPSCRAHLFYSTDSKLLGEADRLQYLFKLFANCAFYSPFF